MLQCQGLYINPTNAKLSGEEFTLKRKDPNLPNDQFEPQLSSFSGANYWDRDTNLLYVVVRGSEPVDIRTTPVIQVFHLFIFVQIMQANNRKKCKPFRHFPHNNINHKNTLYTKRRSQGYFVYRNKQTTTGQKRMINCRMI